MAYQVDVVSLQLFQASFHRDMQALGAIPHEVHHDLAVNVAASVEISRVLGGNDHLVPNAALFHPFANPRLGFLFLVVVRGVDEVPASAVKVVQDIFRRLLVAGTHCEIRCQRSVSSRSVTNQREQ